MIMKIRYIIMMLGVAGGLGDYGHGSGLGSEVASAQAVPSGKSAVELLRYDRPLVDSLASRVVESEELLRTSEIRYAYEEAVKNAFEKLYKKSKQASVADIMAKEAEREVLEEKIAGLKSEIQLAGDTIAMLSDTTVTAVEDPAVAEKMAELNKLTEALNEQRESTEILRQDSVRAAEALALARSGYDSLQTEVNNLTGEVSALRGDEDVKRMSDARAVADRVAEAAAMCKMPLEKMDVVTLESVMREYEANKIRLADSDPAAAKKAAKDAELIRQTINLATPVQNAVKVMAGKYDAAANAKALAGIKALAAGAPKDRKAEINAVAADLEDQDRAFRNLNFLLNQVLEDCGDSGAKDYDIDAKIKTVVSYYSKDAKYPERYVTFNDAVRKLAETMRGRTMNGAEVRHIIDELKRSL